jgi:PAS domain-containing protein
MPPERVLIIREWVKEAVTGENIVVEFQPMLPLRGDTDGLYALVAKLRDFRAPLAGVPREEYLRPAREGGAMALIDRVGLFHAFEAIEEQRQRNRATRVLVPMDLASFDHAQLIWLVAELRRRKAHASGLIIEVDADVLAFVFGDDELVTRANDAFLAMVGRTRAELEAGELRWPDLTPPGWVEADRDALARLAADGRVDPYKKEYLTAQGVRVPVNRTRRTESAPVVW